MRSIILVADNVRSSHNVGSLLRTAEGLGITEVFLSGYTPHPTSDQDTRLPHVARKVHAQIKKTALGAEEYLRWSHCEDIAEVITNLKKRGYQIVALEQSKQSVSILDWEPGSMVALIVGNEVKGLSKDVLSLCDQVVEIPMYGKKESLNVVQATAIALGQLRFTK